MITAPPEVQAVRERWKQQSAAQLRHLIEHPEEIVAHEREILVFAQAHRAEFVAGLRARWLPSTAPSKQRLHALRVLRSLGEPVESSLVVAAAAEDAETADLLFDELDQFVAEGTPLPTPLRDFLIQALQSPRDILRTAALREANLRRMREALPFVEHAIAEEETNPEVWIALAWLRPTGETLTQLVTQLGGFTPNDELFAPLLMFIRSTGDSALRRRAAENCVTHLREFGIGTQISSEISETVRCLAGWPEREAAIEFLEQVAEGARVPAFRGEALRALRPLAPASADRILAEAGLVWTEELETPEADEPAPANGESGKRRKSLTEWAAEISKRGLFSEAETREALAELARRGTTLDSQVSPESTIFLLASAIHRLHYFDPVLAGEAIRHDWLVHDLALSSASRFRPEAIDEFGDEGEASRTVQFLHDGRLYRFPVRVLRDQLDCESVLAAVNRALADAGLAERFVDFEAEAPGQVCVVFADPAKLRELEIGQGTPRPL